ncbi:DUF2231 domain-containing protein [Pacificimonas flava]|uniref:DUF2231 domain-containing protein n=1 Tax=Pacificimonas flava TaxID=1234595 RepID=UPI000683F59F|nr:DUF2231 domain-containing protein [Pacificimonas flava]MBB5279076.1 putative membrane protein [Pacificimonas flava]
MALTIAAFPASAHEAHRQNQTEPTKEEASAQAEGAPLEAIEIAHSESAASPHETHEHGAEENTPFIVKFLGALHPAFVHFPIAFLLAAALAEGLLFLNPSTGLGTTVRFLTWTGAGGGVLAAFLGWFAGGFRLSDRSDLLGMHRWNGTGIAIGGLILVAQLPKGQNITASRKWFRLLLALIAGLLLWQGYMGGELAMGPDHLGLKG